MEKLIKTVQISCLIYGLYGLISWINNGTFIPPVPIKPFLFLAFLIAFVLYCKKKTFLFFIFSIWLTSLIFIGDYIGSIGLNYYSTSYYMKYIEPVFYFISLLFFALFTIVSTLRNKQMNLFFKSLFLLIIGGVLFFSFSDVSTHFYSIGISIYALFLFIFSNVQPANSSTSIASFTSVIFFGIGIINGIEYSAILLG